MSADLHFQKQSVFRSQNTKTPAKKTLWTSFPNGKAALRRSALGSGVLGLTWPLQPAAVLQPLYLELRLLWLPERLGPGHVLFSSGLRRREGAHPTGHRKTDDLG